MDETCRVCGGDGRIGNAFGGQSTTCPACHGTGRRVTDTLLRDVTKTKPSHFRGPDKAPVAAKVTWPQTGEGITLAKEVQASSVISDDIKARLIREIIEYEGSHGKCTQTFSRKVRKQLRAAP
ncbi:MAG: molecular chaperone DnaJ [Polyangiaceae bacterium]|nr:molecular chaperone DnaJ [Polyangiaceae bacterium]